MPRSEQHSRIGAREVEHRSVLTTVHWSASPRSEPRPSGPSARCQARRTASHPQPQQLLALPGVQLGGSPMIDRVEQRRVVSATAIIGSAVVIVALKLATASHARTVDLVDHKRLAPTVPRNGSDSSCATVAWILQSVPTRVGTRSKRVRAAARSPVPLAGVTECQPHIGPPAMVGYHQRGDNYGL